MGLDDADDYAEPQAVISSHDWEEFRRLTLIMPLEQRGFSLEQRGLPTPESPKATSKRRPWV